MDYIYDIVLNFQNEYYDFYEWKPTDKVINVKRVPIYKVSNNDYLNIKNNDVTIDKNTLPKPSKMFLITSGLEIVGVLLDDNGKVVKKSSLIFEETDGILEDKDAIKFTNLKYHINHINKNHFQSRTNKEKSKYINEFLNTLDKQKDEYFLKYLYYDIYNVEMDNIDEIYKNLQILSKKDTSKMYESIKKVNLELKR